MADARASGNGKVLASVWLIPEERVATRVHRCIERCSAITAKPTFNAHITLVGAIEFESEADAIKQVSDVMQEPMNTSEGVLHESLYWGAEFRTHQETSIGNRWNRSCFLRVSPVSKAVAKAREHCLNALDVPMPEDEYDPHISLAYGEYDNQTQEKIHETAREACNDNNLFNTQFRAASVALWRCDPESALGVAHWTQLRAWDIGVEGISESAH